jgi:ribosomal protein S18 acetylase RimI-like enzyme
MERYGQVLISKARREDIPAMTDLLGALFSIERDFQEDHRLQKEGLLLLLERAPEEGCVLVARFEGMVVGMCTVQTLISTAEGGRVGLLEDMVVAEPYRSRGIGRMLLAGIEEWSRQAGLRRLQLLADRNNITGLEFYRRNGWSGTQLICLRNKG